MNGRTDLDASLRGEYAGQAQHFCTVGLARKIADRPWVETFLKVDLPAEGGLKSAGQHADVLGRLRPSPEARKSAAVEVKQLLTPVNRYPEPRRDANSLRTELDGQGADLELLPGRRVRLLCAVGRNHPRLLPEREIRVARLVGGHPPPVHQIGARPLGVSKDFQTSLPGERKRA